MIRSWNKWFVQSLFEGHSRKVGLFLLLLCSVIGQGLSQESMSISQTPYRYIVLKSSFIYIWPFVPFLFFLFSPLFFLLLSNSSPSQICLFLSFTFTLFHLKKKGDLSINVTLSFQAKPTLVNFLRKSSLTKKAKNYLTKIALWTQMMYH